MKKRQTLKKPFATIITVVKNNEKYLEHTIKSIINQSNKNFEYIVIDGNSEDKSLKIIKNMTKKLIFGFLKMIKEFMMHLTKV